MRILFIIFFSFSVIHTYAQSFSVNYKCNYEGSTYQNILYANDTISFWEAVHDSEETDPAPELLVKDLIRGKTLFIDYIFQKKFYVNDSLHPMQWVLANDEKILLNYPCKAAYTFFRGRKYLAYYSVTLPPFIGPWKFGGLPGAILEIVSEDNMYRFLATAVGKASDTDFTDNSFQHNDIISWHDYSRKFIETADQYSRYMQSVSNAQAGTAHLKIGRPEIIYPKAQTGLGVGAE
jgi:hypothetical protein